MPQLTLRTKFLSGFAALSLMVALLIVTSIRAINSLDQELSQVVSVDAKRLDRIGNVADTLIELTALQKDQLLRTILSDTAGAESARRAVADDEVRIDRLFADLKPLLDSGHDRGTSDSLQAKAGEARKISEEIGQLIAKQQMNDALKLVGEKLIPAYEGLLRDARTFRDEQHRKQAEAAASATQAASVSRLLALVCIGLTFATLVLLLLLFRRMSSEMTRMAVQISSGAQSVARAASQMTSVSHSLAEGASEQAASLQQTSASAEEINAMVQHNAANSEQAAKLTSMANKLLNEANSKLEQMLVSMRDISDSSEKISKIIRVIDEIAFQTNMLSLNAAVEAARAGEAGMGFAVVADEVRSLAQRCSQAARDTSALIEESINHSRVGKVRVDEVAAAMRQVTENSSVVGQLSQDVSNGSAEQARGIEQISKAITQIQNVTQSNAASAEQGASAGAQMSTEAAHLEATVNHLRKLLGIGAGDRESSVAVRADHAFSMN